MSDFNIDEVKKRMDGAVSSVKNDFAGIRTGRADPRLLDNINVDAYGSAMPLNQLGTVNAPEPRTLSVQVWDVSMVSAVEKAISSSPLGLNPQTEGQVVRINLPELSEERRKDYVKLAGQKAEEGRIAIRNVRKDANNNLKRMEGAKEISEDEMHRSNDQVQKLTDEHVAAIDEALKAKTEEIMQV